MFPEIAVEREAVTTLCASPARGKQHPGRFSFLTRPSVVKKYQVWVDVPPPLARDLWLRHWPEGALGSVWGS